MIFKKFLLLFLDNNNIVVEGFVVDVGVVKDDKLVEKTDDVEMIVEFV